MKLPQFQTTRREFLRRSGLSILTGSTVTWTGCTETLPPLGQQVRYGRVDVPESAIEPGGPDYRRWLPAASALPDDKLDPGFVNLTSPRRFDLDVDGDGILNQNVEFFQIPYIDYFGIGYENYERVMSLHSLTSTFVFKGNIEPTTVVETLEQSGYNGIGSYASYDLFERTDNPRTAAVSEDAIVWANHNKSTTIVEAVIDAERGAVERHHEVDESFALATEMIGTRLWTWIGGLTLDPLGGALVGSTSVTFDENALYNIMHNVYPEGTNISERTIRDELEKQSQPRDSWAVDITIEGRVLTIEMRQPYESAQNYYEGIKIPQITWGVAHNEGAIAIRHEAGDSTPAEQITFYVEGTGGRSPTDVQFADSHERIESGDAITIDVPSDPGAERIVGEFAPANVQSSSYFGVYTLP